MLFGGLKEKGIMDLESAPEDCCLRFGRTTGTESGKGGLLYYTVDKQADTTAV